MNEKTLELLRHILDARIDNSDSAVSYALWCTFRDIMEYAAVDNIECLRQFDYLLTNEEKGI